MDTPDKEFEQLLGQFKLRQPAPFPSEVSDLRRERSRVRWMMPAAAAVALAVIGLLWFRSPTTSAFAKVEIAGDSSYRVGEVLHPGTSIQSGPKESMVLSTKDLSRVEMRALSNAMLESSDDGTGLRLNSGSVLVTAAKQKPGKSFYVVTPDTRVVVTGTIFLVEVQPAGSRVAVLEGDVEVRYGTIAKTLSQGEQLETNPTTVADSLTKTLSWSRQAQELVAMLPKEPVTATEPIVSFTPAPPPRLTRTEVIPRAQNPPPAEAPAPEPAPTPEKKQQQSDAGADGPGPQILARACTQCHNMQLATSLRGGNRDAYAALVERQKAYGAPISGTESETLIDYLFRTYGVPPRPAR